MSRCKKKYSDVDLLWLGPVLAYSISNKRDSVERSRIFSALKSKKYRAVILCFGEIDCRVHILRQADIQKISVEKIVKDVAFSLFDFSEKLAFEFGVNIFIWGPIPTGPEGMGNDNPDFPKYGTTHERNYATKIFNTFLNQYSMSSRLVHHFTIFDRLVDESLNSISKYYKDGCHLNKEGFLLAKNEFLKIAQSHGINSDFWEIQV